MEFEDVDQINVTQDRNLDKLLWTGEEHWNS
jgi:hypothetical protein